MTRRLRRKIAPVAIGAVGLAALMASAQASSRSAHEPTPAEAIIQATDIHNGGVKDMVIFARQAKKAYKNCVVQQGSDPPDWRSVEFDGKALQLIEQKDLKPYNKRLLGWIDAIDRVKARGNARDVKQNAIKYLQKAHTTHGNEFYDFGTVGTDLVQHDCEKATGDLNTAASLGDKDKAWINEHDGLLNARDLLKVKKPALSDKLLPYAEAGVG
jgi:hypothetical protein